MNTPPPAPQAPGLLARWWRKVPHPLDAFLVTRAVLLLACALGRDLLPHPDAVGAMPLRPDSAQPFIALPALPWLDGWARWDAAWYWAIARDGYGAALHEQSAAAFFPLYPLVTGLLALPLRLLLPADQAFYLAGFLLSNAAFLLALVLLSRLAGELVDQAAARRAVWLCACYPFALFFSAVYTESLFLACTLAALWLARRGRFWGAAAAACLAGLTRNIGALVGLAVALEYLRHNAWDWRALLRRGVLPVLLAPLGCCLFAAHLWVTRGDALLFLRAQGAWGHELALPPLAECLSLALSTDIPWRARLDGWACLGVMALFPVLVVVAWKRFGASLGLFGAAALAAPLTAGLAAGLGRYSAVLFPAFLVLGQSVRRPSTFRALCLTGLALAAVFLSGFSHWEPPY